MAHLLLVEDDTTFSKLLSNFLGKHGHEVQVCSTIAGAREAMRTNGSSKHLKC